MMRFALFFLCTFCILFAGDTLEVTALNFSADEKNGIVELNDNVEIKKGGDELYAQKVIINVDKNRVPTSYAAYGGVTFVIITQDGRKLNGEANEVFYNPTSGEYRLVGNGKVREEGKINVITGEEIILNNDTGYANITGTSNKPAKLIFQMEDKNEKRDSASK